MVFPNNPTSTKCSYLPLPPSPEGMNKIALLLTSSPSPLPSNPHSHTSIISFMASNATRAKKDREGRIRDNVELTKQPSNPRCYDPKEEFGVNCLC